MCVDSQSNICGHKEHVFILNALRNGTINIEHFSRMFIFSSIKTHLVSRKILVAARFITAIRVTRTSLRLWTGLESLLSDRTQCFWVLWCFQFYYYYFFITWLMQSVMQWAKIWCRYNEDIMMQIFFLIFFFYIHFIYPSRTPVAKYDAHCYTKLRKIVAGNIFFEKSKHTMFSCP